MVCYFFFFLFTFYEITGKQNECKNDLLCFRVKQSLWPPMPPLVCRLFSWVHCGAATEGPRGAATVAEQEPDLCHQRCRVPACAQSAEDVIGCCSAARAPGGGDTCWETLNLNLCSWWWLLLLFVCLFCVWLDAALMQHVVLVMMMFILSNVKLFSFVPTNECRCRCYLLIPWSR